MNIYQLDFQVMGGPAQVRVQAEDEALAHQAAEAAATEIRRIEAKYSRYRVDSLVGRVNQAAGNGEVIPCDVETNRIFDYAQQLYTHSQGLFDITSGPLRRAWRFDVARLPTPAEIDAVLGLIGWSKVERHHGGIRLPLVGMEIDLGGFGKEYAVDRATEILVTMGLRHGYINLAGDVRVIGAQTDGSPWRIGIRHPREKNSLIAEIPVYSGSVATSGDYERFIEIDGRRYCHILDPRTGWPVDYWQSITVMAPIAVAAGSCSTIAFIKEGAAMEFLQKTGFGYLAVDNTGIMYHKDN